MNSGAASRVGLAWGKRALLVLVATIALGAGAAAYYVNGGRHRAERMLSFELWHRRFMRSPVAAAS